MRETTPQLPQRLEITAFEKIGVRAFITTRAAGDFGPGDAPLPQAASLRYEALLQSMGASTSGMAAAQQVHGTTVAVHADGFSGFKRLVGVDGHFTTSPKVALGVTVADCVPVFLAHESGAIALLHAGWRGVAGGMLGAGLREFAGRTMPLEEVMVHFGPSICGRCYEVGPDTYRALTGWEAKRHHRIDLRALLLEQAREAGVRFVSVSPQCTRCDNQLLFSHRCGDGGRQLAVIHSAKERR